MYRCSSHLTLNSGSVPILLFFFNVGKEDLGEVPIEAEPME